MAAQLVMGMDPRERLRRLSVIFEVALRMKIVLELYMREMSARQFYEEFGGGSLSRVSQNFTRLAEGGWLRHVHSEGPGGTRHGGVEHFFRATAPPFIDSESWALVPFSVRATTAWNFLKLIIPRLKRHRSVSDHAMHGRGLTCNTFLLDEEGWMRATTATTSRFGLLFEGRRTRVAAPSQRRGTDSADVFLSPSTRRRRRSACGRRPARGMPERTVGAFSPIDSHPFCGMTFAWRSSQNRTGGT